MSPETLNALLPAVSFGCLVGFIIGGFCGLFLFGLWTLTKRNGNGRGE